MSEQPLSRAAVNKSYHPHGFDSSASLQRARQPYWTRNVITGTAIVSFIVGAYMYSISAVKQDDFSDVVDLLPPVSERAKIRTIEDEARDKLLSSSSPLSSVPITSSPDAPSQRLPSADSSNTTTINSSSSSSSFPSISSLVPRFAFSRLSENEWIKARGWVEEDKGNVIVWGAPNVDNIGGLWDKPVSKGGRRV